jgi:signal transduction histidine kinase
MVTSYDQAMRERIDRMLQVRASVATSAFGLAMLGIAWTRQTHFAVMLGLFIGHAVAATIFGKLSFGKLDRRQPNLAFTIINTVYGLVTLWSFDFEAPAFLVVPLMVLLMDGFSEGDVRNWILAMLACFVVVPIALGAPVLSTAVAVMVGWVVHWFSEGRAQTLRLALTELREQALVMQAVNAELGDLHRKMVAHERLSSLGMMAAGVAHEVNNPLAFVTSNINGLVLDLEALSKSPALRAEYRDEVLPATVAGLKRITEIVGDLRRFAHADPDKKQVFPLAHEVERALRVCKGKLGDSCQVVVDVDDALIVEGQPGQIDQLLVNLFSNAAHAMRHQRGRLEVTARRRDLDVVITVADQGEGMTPEVLQRIYEPFFTTKPIGQGTGLGLSVVHGIVRAHGGTIEVRSNPGEGAVFTIRLPLAKVARALTAA